VRIKLETLNPKFEAKTNDSNTKILFSILSGIFLAMAFPKLNFYPLAWVALVPFFYVLLLTNSLKERLKIGFVFGTVFFALNLFWVNELFRFVTFWAVLGFLMLVLFQMLFVLLFCYIFHQISERIKIDIFFPIVVAFLWVFVEWLRALGPFGVSAGVVGYSQANFLAFIQIASFSSVYGVSFVVIMFNMALANGLARKKYFGLIAAVVIIAGGFYYGQNALWDADCTRTKCVYTSIAIIQPNIDQMDKMKTSEVMRTYEIQDKMSRQAASQGAEIIIWPETAVFSYLLQDQVLSSRIRKLAVETGKWLIIGTPYYEKGKIFNSMVSISPSGEIVSRFNKLHLVPFGEYLPFRTLLFPILKAVGYYDQDFSPSQNDNAVFAAGKNIVPAICFESTFPSLVKQRVKINSSFILTLTNDAWFGNSSAAYFHLNTGIFRAIENRKYFIQAANTGISGSIDPYGRVMNRSRLNSQEVLFIPVPVN